MNKTVSLSIRIVAILAAAGAGYAWYTIHTKNIEKAMTDTAWMKSDPELNAGEEFTQRMDAVAKAKGVLDKKRADIKDLESQKSGLLDQLANRDAKISDLNEEKKQLENEKTDLIRKRDEFQRAAREAEGKASQLQSELESATAQIAKKIEQISEMKTQDEFNEQVAKTDTAVDNLQKVVGRYSQLDIWVSKQGLKAPFPRNPLEERTEDTPGKPGPALDTAPEKIMTKIVTVDRKNGLMAVTLGIADNIQAGKIYSVSREDDPIGDVRVSEIRDDGLTILSILPESNLSLFNNEMLVTLTLAAPASAAKAPVAPAPKAAPAPTPAPAGE